MSAERAQGRGWVRIPASRGEQPAAAARTAGYDRPTGYDRPATGYDRPAPGYDRPATGYDRPATGYDRPATGYDRPATGYERSAAYDHAPYATAPHIVQPAIYLSLVKRWREAGRTLPGHPDEEWERLISQPCWPGR